MSENAQPDPPATRPIIGHDNRRKFPRRRGHGASLKFRRLNSLPSGEPDVYHEGTIVDVSEGGMCFYSEAALRRGEKLEYVFRSTSGEKNRDGVARVLHAHADAGSCFVGVEYIG